MHDTKICNDCGVDKSSTNFCKNRYQLDGLNYYCRECQSKRSKISRGREALESQMYRQILKGASKRNISVVLSKESFYEWFCHTPRCCEYCGVTLDQHRLLFGTRLEIDRKNNEVGYCIENICFACRRCNTSKRDYFSYIEWKEIASKYIQSKVEQELIKVNGSY